MLSYGGAEIPFIHLLRAMPDRRIHHLVLCVADLAAAQATYRRLGFTTTPRAAMPFGTANSLVQLQGAYLELLAVADAAAIPQPAPGGFGFAAYNADFLRRREGMSMLVFASADARRDHDAFAAAGLATYPPFHFQRQATLPDGSQATVAFTLCFVTEPRMPDVAFFACQEHAPEHFWQEEYQRHANGARGVSEVVMRAEAPGDFAGFFRKLLGDGAVERDGDGIAARTAGGRITVLTPRDFAERFPGTSFPAAPSTPHFAAFRVMVADLDAVEAGLRHNDIRYRRAGAAVQIAPADAFGVALEFAAA